MKRVWKPSDAAQSELLSRHRSSSAAAAASKSPQHSPYTFTRTNYPNYRCTHDVNAQTHSSSAPSSSPPLISFSIIIDLFSNKPLTQDLRAREDLASTVSRLRDELVQNVGDSDKIVRILEEKVCSSLCEWKRGEGVVELLNQLRSWPHLALEVFGWRRQQVSSSTSISAEEYAKAIIIAGKAKNVELSFELFTEAINKRMKTTSIYNALMSAYMFNGHTAKCQSLFRDLKNEPDCRPTIVTYNILISAFGRLMLVDHMEATVGV